MTAENPTLLLTGQCTGVRRELGRYTVDGIDRVLYGQRGNHSTIQITDKPAVLAHGRRSFMVDALDASDGYAAIQALVRDYLTQARRTHRIPAASVTNEWFDDLADSFRYDRQRATALQLDAVADGEVALPQAA